ncbi:sialate O-acetylesterase [Streptococcus uberis]|uniref:sialate O-acetylesterase n=1 Tax=Streptococcus uberis TaxID=1349 RepID=UPI001939CE4E|nr:sialate O-acetylesterase [Streptococcus uberis]
MGIENHLNTIIKGVFGRDVRQAIHDAIEEAYNDASLNGNANMEVSLSRGNYRTLPDRLNAEFENVSALLKNIGDGSPKGTYPSLSSLQSAYPSGTSGIFITVDNGHWYYYSDGWKDGGVYQSDGLNDNNIGYNKINSNELGYSFYQVSKVINDFLQLKKGEVGFVNTKLTPKWGSWKSVSLNDTGKFDVVKSDIVNDNKYDVALFENYIDEITFKGYQTGVYIVLGFNDDTAYHIAIEQGGVITLRSHQRTSSSAITMHSYQSLLTQSISSSDEVNIKYTGSIIEIRVNNLLVLTLQKDQYTENLFKHVQFGILEVTSSLKNLANFYSFKTNNYDINLNSNDAQDTKNIDLMLFMGQSNMAGRGTASEAPSVDISKGMEFRAISDPTKLNPIVEPFGVNENSTGGVSEPGMKTGSLVSSFVNSYHSVTGRKIIAVSASKGGSTIAQWQPGTAFLNDVIYRLETAKNYLTTNGYTIDNIYMIWCQGESDGDSQTSAESYKSQLSNMITEMENNGVNHTFIIRIGNYRDDDRYQYLINAQSDYTKTKSNVTLVSTKFDTYANLGLMKDAFHYKQQAYNEVGEQAGLNTGFYVNNKKEPTIFDFTNNNLYFSVKD